jgi:hypothetical protein
MAVAHLCLVRSMRAIPFLIGALLACETTSAITPEQAGQMIGSARYLYHQQVHTMLQAAVAPEFMRHHERLKGGTVKYAFQLDSQGHVVSVKTHSTGDSRWGEETLARKIRTLKFPPVPPQAMKEEKQEGHTYIEVTGDMGWKR